MAFSGQAVITFAAVKMLRSKSPVILWIIAVIFCMINAYSNSFATSANFQVAWSIISIAVFAITYVAFSSLKVIKALLIVACIFLISFLANFLTACIFIYGFGLNITEGATFAYAHPSAYMFSVIIDMILLAVMFCVMAMLLRRLITGNVGEGLIKTMIFLPSQVVLIIAVCCVIRAVSVQDDSVFLPAVILISIMFVIYFIYYLVARRIQLQELVDVRIEQAKEQTELVLERAHSIIAESERVAKMRHDFRNRVQVIELLYVQNEIDDAMRLLDQLLSESSKEFNE